MREYFNRVGKIVPKAVELGSRNMYYGCTEYNRFYGYYALNNRVCVRLKMKLKNG
jgi:hypothetical protein